VGVRCHATNAHKLLRQLLWQDILLTSYKHPKNRW